MYFLAISTNLANTGQRTVQYSGEHIFVGGLEGSSKVERWNGMTLEKQQKK
jgi:hypothetical protein